MLNIISVIMSVVPSHELYLGQKTGIAKYDQSILGTSECNIESPRVAQESDTLMFVASDTTENNVLLFSALESIDTCYLDLLVEFFAQRAMRLHILHQIRSLAFVWCDDTDF